MFMWLRLFPWATTTGKFSGEGIQELIESGYRRELNELGIKGG